MAKNPFKREPTSYKNKEPSTPYQKARQEWDERIGSGAVQARNWRIVALCSLAVAILLAIVLLVITSIYKPFVYVAQVGKGDQVINVAPLNRSYQPNQAQVEYFLGQFIEKARSVSLDPVVTKKNWMTAYSYTAGQAAKQFSQVMQSSGLANKVGKETVSVKVTDVQPISGNTYQATWQETMTSLNGNGSSSNSYTGIFTIEIKQPTTEQGILENPLGLHIVNFNLKEHGAE